MKKTIKKTKEKNIEKTIRRLSKDYPMTIR